MKIERTKVTKILISDLMDSHRLDPVTVIAEDYEPGRGKLIVSCYDRSWNCYWGGMGDGSTIADFITTVSPDYVANCLQPGIDHEQYDPDQIEDQLKAIVVKRRLINRPWSKPSCHDDEPLDKDEARELWERIEATMFSPDPHENNEILTAVIGAEWWYRLPTAPHPHYQYLCRIVQAVQDAFNMEKKAVATTETTLQKFTPDHPNQPFCWAVLDTQHATPPIIYGQRTADKMLAHGRAILPLRADPIVLDPAGMPKLKATMLEQRMAEVLNSVQAWRDAVPGTPFPAELDTHVRALVMTYEARRK